MQVWTKKAKNTIVSNVADFLRGHPYEKRAHLDKVLPALDQVIRNSQKVTILFVFDGNGKIQGTPFDTDINDLQKQYARDLHAAHLPFITVLVARGGAVFDYTINYPGMVVIPHTAEPEPPPVTNAPPVAVAAAPPPKPQRKIEIIMSGKTNAAPAVVAPLPIAPAVSVHVPAPAPAPARPPTPAPVVVEVPQPPAPIAAAPLTPVIPEVAKPIPVAPSPPAVITLPANIAETPPVEPPARPVRVAPPPGVIPLAPPANVSASSGAQVALFIMAFSLLTIAVVLVVFLVRRFRGGSQPSPISQSIDRTR
jgi:hypothetical protein